MNKRQLTAAAVDYIEMRLEKPLSVEEIARELHYSSHYLLHEFHEISQLSLYDYIKRRRLHLAGQQLLATDKTIIDVALDNGYQNQQSFTKAFTTLYKTTPKKFRAAQKEFGIAESLLLFDQLTKDYQGAVKTKQAVIGELEDICQLMRAVKGTFPYWEERTFVSVITQRIGQGEVIISKVGKTCLGLLIIDKEKNLIEGLTSLPVTWSLELEKQLIDYTRALFNKKRTTLFTTTFRAQDKLDIGCRERLLHLSFKPAGELVEFNYPTERFVLEV
ncbi:helix-turn-helix transcriptional regulator [Enterococcus sp. LJL128]|uniref:helix-turn-helix transcriptional regulator n=1 Tax=Enterococcus sp. LJL51 TaxID=3416656 RepID=UPI003CEFB6D3